MPVGPNVEPGIRYPLQNGFWNFWAGVYVKYDYAIEQNQRIGD
jgi:hypothetical protein